MFGRDARSGVFDFDENRAARLIFAACAKEDATARRNRIARVQKQISKDLLQLSGAAVNKGQILFILAHDFDLRPAKLRIEKLQRVVEHAVNVNLAELRHAARAREVQKISY